MKLKLDKPLGEILQPLVDMVPKFKDGHDLHQWIKTYFPCGSNSVAALSSLAKWKQNYKNHCALCIEVEDIGCENCPLEKVEKNVCGLYSFYQEAMTGDKQPLIEALELASVYALVDELRQKCEDTVREAIE